MVHMGRSKKRQKYRHNKEILENLSSLTSLKKKKFILSDKKSIWAKLAKRFIGKNTTKNRLSIRNIYMYNQIKEDETSETIDEHLKEDETSETIDEHVKEDETSETIDEHVKEDEASETIDEHVKEDETSETIDEHVKEDETSETMDEYVTEDETSETIDEHVKEDETSETIGEHVKEDETSETIDEHVKEDETSEKIDLHVKEDETSETIYETVKEDETSETIDEHVKEDETSETIDEHVKEDDTSETIDEHVKEVNMIVMGESEGDVSEVPSEYDVTTDVSDYEDPKGIISNSPIYQKTDVDLLAGQTFTITIPRRTWRYEVKPTTAAPHKLQRQWCNVFAKEINKVVPTCSITFQYHNVSQKESSRRTYVNGKAHCKVDGCAKFSFWINKKPHKEDVKVVFQLIKPVSGHHTVFHKRHLTGKDRKYTQAEVLEKGASTVHYEKLSTMLPIEMESGNLSKCQTKEVLRKAGSEWRVHDVLHQDPFTELWLTSELLSDEDHSSKYIKGYVQFLSVKPFITVLFTEDQLKIAKLAITKGNGIFYLDATGSIVSKLPGEDKKNLYYAMVLPGSAKGDPPIPVVEFVTNRQNTHVISLALSQFRHELMKYAGKINPKRIEVDFSWALIHSVLQAIGITNIHRYLAATYSILLGDDTHYPTTVVHICSTHMLKAMKTNISEHISDKGLKELFVRCFALLQNCTNLQQVIELWEKMVSVFGSNKSSQTVDEHVKEINMIVMGESEGQSSEEPLECGAATDVSDDEDKGIRQNSPFAELFKYMTDETHVDNTYYAGKALQLVAQQYMPLLPLWSGLLLGDITRHKDTQPKECNTTRDSNSTVENWMKIVKKDTLQGRKRLRVGAFVRKMHVSLLGRTNGYLHGIDTYQSTKKSKQLPSTNRKDQTEHAQEIWQRKSAPIDRYKPFFHSPPKHIPTPKKKRTVNDIEKQASKKQKIVEDNTDIVVKEKESTGSQQLTEQQQASVNVVQQIDTQPKHKDIAVKEKEIIASEKLNVCKVTVVQKSVDEHKAKQQKLDINKKLRALALAARLMPGLYTPTTNEKVQTKDLFPLHGIRNTDNACWLISSLQSLASVSSLQLKAEGHLEQFLSGMLAEDGGHVMSKVEKYHLTENDLSSMEGNSWLNDNVIMAFLKMLCSERVAVMATYFIEQLKKKKGVKKWLPKSRYSMLLIPVNENCHWSLCVVDVITYHIRWYDSVPSHSHRKDLELIESFAKTNIDNGNIDWVLENVQELPTQTNGHDCGVFMLQFASCLVTNQEFLFSQEDIPLIRRRMLVEVLAATLLPIKAT